MCRFDHAFFFGWTPRIRCQNPTVRNPAIGWHRPGTKGGLPLSFAPGIDAPP